MRAEDTQGALPLAFEANRGQTADEVKFLARGQGYALFLTTQDAVLRLEDGNVRLALVGANDSARVAGAEPLPGKANYFLGNDPKRWLRNVPTYRRVRYEQVYHGVDLVYYGNEGRLEYDFVVAPEAEPDQIALRFDGADALDIDAAGDLVVTVGDDEVRQKRPVVYQHVGGTRQLVLCDYVIRGDDTVGFDLAAYDTARTLVIDPVLEYSTYAGGGGNDGGNAITVDAVGDIYVVGSTDSIDFPTEAPNQGAYAGAPSDGLIVKINAAGTARLYSTYLGGGIQDQLRGVAVDALGQAYVAGLTNSTDFPVVNAYQPVGRNHDVTITKLSADGATLLYSTYLGGNSVDTGLAIAIDGAGAAYVTGQTRGPNFPEADMSPIQDTVGGGFPSGDAFVVKINPGGMSLGFSTYLGGTENDSGNGIALDAAGNVYVAGFTESTDFPVQSPLQPAISGTHDGFLAKINPAGTMLVYSTYIGGTGGGDVQGLAVAAGGAAFLTGSTDSTDLPGASTSPIQPTFGGLGTIFGFPFGDAFVVKVNAAGTAIDYATYLGGSNADLGSRIAVDAFGNAYVTGFTNSTDFPTQDPTQAANPGGDFTAFVTKVNSGGTALVFSTYLGTSGSDGGFDIAVDGSGVYVSGITNSAGFPGTAGSPIQDTYGGGAFDITITKFSGFDSDGDGLLDDWEDHGFTAANGDFVDLPAMGADSQRKDIFVEIDSMTGQAPQQAALDLVIDAFANAPVDNPDGSTGITLHCIVDDEVPYTEFLGSESTAGVYDWQGSGAGVTYFQDLKDAHFTPSLAQVAHYCLFAHKLDFGDQTVSGMSRGGAGTGFAASEFIVSLGGVGVGGIGSVCQQAGTFMHELGHDLGLRHGGGDSINRKPNYLSVMNHSFQMSGLIHGGASPLFAYSCCALPDLNENSQLDESVGLNGGAAIAGLGTKWFCAPDDPRTTTDANGPIDWDCDTTIDTALVKADINADSLPAGFSTAPILTGFNDWAAIVFTGGAVGATGQRFRPRLR
ncbi:MAG: DUF7948 domain-containing protein [Planctomycetota bacterium]